MTKLLSSLSWTLSRKNEKFLVSDCVRFQANQRSQRAEKNVFKSRDDGFDHTRASHLSHYCVFVFLIRRYTCLLKKERA
jgi:hypothetical protein